MFESDNGRWEGRFWYSGVSESAADVSALICFSNSLAWSVLVPVKGREFFLYFWLHCDVGVVFSDFGVDVPIFTASFCIVVYALPALLDWGSDLLIYDV